MEITTHSVLQRSALESGLVSAHQLEDALASFALPDESSSAGPPAVADEALGERLIALGYLNRWQVEQLREGRTRFRLGPYRIVDAIGKGGMGHVFKGEHVLLGRIEAVKVLPKSKSSPEAIASFHREIRVQAQLDHPNLVRVSYADSDGDTHFLVTEYVPGTDLRRLVRRHGALPAEIAATIVAQAAEGLHYAHRKGLVHRDIKPGNLLVTPDGHAKLTDLGLAWFLMEDIGPVAVGNPRSVVGTSDYLAPESIADPDQVRPVSDIYSLGCTLYYALTGKVPFPGGSTADKMRRHLDETPLNPLHFNPDLPRELCEVLARMMEKNPGERVPTAAQVVELLRPWCTAEIGTTLSRLTSQHPQPTPNREQLPPAPVMYETAVFEVDDLASDLSAVECPSQISQSTESVASETEDTLADTPDPASDQPVVIPPRDGALWRPILFAVLALALLAVWFLT